MITKERLAPFRPLFFISLLLAAALIALFAVRANLVYSASDFGFAEEISPCDKDGDRLDDFADMVAGARAYIATDPLYESAYYAGGYPNDGKGVCTDVIWQAFAAAGYCLKDMVDADIAANKSLYFAEGESSDPNINFRRVRNLRIFFERYAKSLSISTSDPEDWMAGDIVIYNGHIALCSDKRNAAGLPYIIHHGNPEDGAVEADQLESMQIVGHYRFYG